MILTADGLPIREADAWGAYEGKTFGVLERPMHTPPVISGPEAGPTPP